MRLIDVAVLENFIREHGCVIGDDHLLLVAADDGRWHEVLPLIKTAYDVDEVVEQLEKEKQTSTSAKAEAIIGMCGASANHYGGEECAYQKAIEIVKGGGVDAKTNF